MGQEAPTDFGWKQNTIDPFTGARLVGLTWQSIDHAKTVIVASVLSKFTSISLEIPYFLVLQSDNVHLLDIILEILSGTKCTPSYSPEKPLISPFRSDNYLRLSAFVQI